MATYIIRIIGAKKIDPAYAFLDPAEFNDEFSPWDREEEDVIQ
jgi:hypothetical protein